MKKIKQFVAFIAFTALLVTSCISVGALSPVVIGDTNKDLKIDILDLVYASVNEAYHEAIDYDADGFNDINFFRTKLLREETDAVIEYAVNTEYFDILDED